MLGHHQPCPKKDSDVGIKLGTPTLDKHTHWWNSDVATHQISKTFSLFLYKMRVVCRGRCISHSASGLANSEIQKTTSRDLVTRWNLDIYNNLFIPLSFSCLLKILFSRVGGNKLFKVSGEFIHLGPQTKLLFRDYNPSWLSPWQEMMLAVWCFEVMLCRTLHNVFHQHFSAPEKGRNAEPSQNLRVSSALTLSPVCLSMSDMDCHHKTAGSW